MIDIDALHARLADLPGLGGVSMTQIAGRLVFGFNGLIAAIDPRASIDEAERAIRKVYANPPAPPASAPIRIQTPMPAPAAVPTTQPQGNQMSTPAPAAGNFAASIKAMMDSARNDLAQARTDGLAKVGEAVGKMVEAKTATQNVTANMVKTIEDEAAAVLSELGQISNDIGV